METGKLKIKIRNLTPYDITNIKEVEKLCFEVLWPPESFKKEMNNDVSVFIGTEIGNRLVGYMGAWIIVDEAHITTVAVDPSFRGKGIGKLLVWSMMNICVARECAWATLEVRVNNTPACSLYESFGFKTISVRKKYYETGEDANVMILRHILKPEFREKMEKIKKEWEENLCLSWELNHPVMKLQ